MEGIAQQENPSKIALRCGEFSLDAEGKPADILVELFREYVPRLIDYIQKESDKEIPVILANSLLEFCKSLNTPATPSPGVGSSTDGTVSEDRDIPRHI